MDKNLAAAGLATAVLASARDGRVLLLEMGARALGLFAPGDDRNFLWVNPALRSPADARKFFTVAGWPNPGGDRTWLSPEHALFFGGNEPSWETYQVPAALDPGSFRLRVSRGTAQFDGRARLPVRDAATPATVRISKRIELAPNPLPAGACDGVAYAGYRSRITFSGRSPAPIALWQLLQLPHGGTMLVAIKGRARARVLFGDVNRRDWSTAGGLFRHVMDANGNHKLGLFAQHCTGRAGYLYPAGGREWSLVIRQWSVKPTGRYVDTPWNRRHGPGDCFQLCNVNHASLGRFSELEYHMPAGSREDRSEVWAFRGKRRAVGEVARFLLGARV